MGTYPEIDRSEKSRTTGQFGNLTGNGLIFEKVTGQRVAAVADSVAAVATSNVDTVYTPKQTVCPLQLVLRTHVGVVCRVHPGAILRVSCLVFTESKNLNMGTSDVQPWHSLFASETPARVSY